MAQNMTRLSFYVLALILAFTVAARSSTCEREKRIVAIGDLHGDLEATRSAFRLPFDVSTGNLRASIISVISSLSNSGTSSSLK